MTIQEILSKFEAKGPPWGDKLTPKASKELHSLLIDLSLDLYKVAYIQGKQDSLKNKTELRIAKKNVRQRAKRDSSI